MSVDHYCVFGDPIEHSKSPRIHQLFAEQCNQSLLYDKQRVEPENFKKICDAFFSNGGKGLNITLPLKEQAFNYADKNTVRAELAGAVNTLAKKTTTIWGDNTDGIGLANDLFNNLGWNVNNKKILVLGAGGAVRGILAPLLEQQPAQLHIANRTASKAQELVEIFNRLGVVSASDYESLPTVSYDLIINGTSLSLSGDVPPMPSTAVTTDTCCYDLAYSKEPTAFLQWAGERGCTHLSDGLGMLVEQAAEAFYIWRGIRPATTAVIQTLRQD